MKIAKHIIIGDRNKVIVVIMDMCTCVVTLSMLLSALAGYPFLEV